MNKVGIEKLKRPYKWIERRVLLQDQVLYVPERIETYDQFKLPSWTDIFGNSNPVHIEYCSGNGGWIAAKALENPEINWIAVERKFDRVKKIWAKLRKNKLKNLLIIYGEGKLSTSLYMPELSVSSIYVNFPDPWPKRKHWKNRIIEQEFLGQVSRILVPQGSVYLVTDDEPYSQVMIKEMLASEIFSSNYNGTEMEGYGTSYFEDLWRSQGKKIHYQHYFKK